MLNISLCFTNMKCKSKVHRVPVAFCFNCSQMFSPRSYLKTRRQCRDAVQMAQKWSRVCRCLANPGTCDLQWARLASLQGEFSRVRFSHRQRWERSYSSSADKDRLLNLSYLKASDFAGKVITHTCIHSEMI